MAQHWQLCTCVSQELTSGWSWGTGCHPWDFGSNALIASDLQMGSSHQSHSCWLGVRFLLIIPGSGKLCASQRSAPSRAIPESCLMCTGVYATGNHFLPIPKADTTLTSARSLSSCSGLYRPQRPPVLTEVHPGATGAIKVPSLAGRSSMSS